MLFHVEQTHAPKDCPYGKGGSRSLFDGESKDDIAHLQKFLQPGAGVTVAEITPVSTEPAPLPA